MSENKRKKTHTNLECVQEGFANGVAPNFPLSDEQKWDMVDNAEKAYGEFLDALGCNWREDPNSSDTPRRVAKAYVFDLWKGRYEAMSEITLFPSATDNNYLRVAPQQTYLYVKANGYKDSIAFMEICPGTATQMIVATQPVAGAQNGDLLSIQPKIELRDQYDNLCIYGVSSYLYLTASAVNETGVWTLSG